MRKDSVAVVGFVFFLSICFTTTVQGGAVSLSSTLDDLVGGNPVLVGTDVVTTIMNGDSLRAEVISAAFSGDGDDYVYLYQIKNVGTAGNSAAEMFTLWPFHGANDNTDLGRLSGTLPAGFLPGGVEGADTAFVEELSQGTVISFYFTKLYGQQINIGQHSAVLYVQSKYAPDMIVGNLIGGTAESGPVVGPVVVPVPEPAILLLLGSFSAAALNFRRRK